MIEGKIRHILPRIGSVNNSAHIAPEVKMVINLGSEEEKLGMVFTERNYKRYDPGHYYSYYHEEYVSGNNNFHHLYERKQLEAAHEIGKYLRDLIMHGDGRILFLPQWCPQWFFRWKNTSKLHPGPIILRYQRDAPVIANCDGEGYPLYSAAKMYYWNGFVVEIFIQREGRYIYDRNDRAIERLYPELNSTINKIEDGLSLSF